MRIWRGLKLPAPGPRKFADIRLGDRVVDPEGAEFTVVTTETHGTVTTGLFTARRNGRAFIGAIDQLQWVVEENRWRAITGRLPYKYVP